MSRFVIYGIGKYRLSGKNNQYKNVIDYNEIESQLWVLRDRFFEDRFDPGIDRIPLPIFRRPRAPVFLKGF